MSFTVLEPSPANAPPRPPLTERMANKRQNVQDQNTVTTVYTGDLLGYQLMPRSADRACCQASEPQASSLPLKRIRAEPVVRASQEARNDAQTQGLNGASTFACFSIGGGPSTSAGADTAKTHAVPASLNTFDDLAMSKAAAPLQDQAAMNARKNTLLSLRLAGAPLRGALPAGAAAPGPRPAAAAATAEPAPLLTVPHCLPYDWALKSSARFSCSQRFVAYDASIVASARHVLNAGMNCQRHHWHALPVQERWHLSLASWRYPQDSLDSAAAAALQRAAPALIEQRLHGWRQAFTGAYMAVRHSQACAVYVETPVGVRQPCTVLFCAAGTRGCPLPHALVSTSSQHLRARLLAAGATFSMPLAPQYAAALARSAADAANPADVAGDPRDPSDANADVIRLPGATTAAPRDFSLQSLLLFTGPQQVHMLFDWMHYEGGLGQQQGVEAMDVPAILAPKCFPGATLWKPHVKSTSAAAPQGPAPSAPGRSAAQADQHILELSGPLPPWVLCRVSAVLGETLAQGGHTFTAELNTASHNLALNVWDPEALKAATRDKEDLRAPCLVYESNGWEVAPGERDVVCAAPAAMHKRVVLRAVVEPLHAPATSSHDQIPVQYQLKLSG